MWKTRRNDIRLGNKMKEYTTIPQKESIKETVIEKSRFIASAVHVETVEQAMEFVSAKRKRYFDATHNCYAYIVGDKAKFSDDGEPQGTAGLPILECIKNNSLDRVCVVITRYFGGIKLGAGGLVRAYGGCCAEVLRGCQRVNMTECVRFEVEVDYSLLKPLRRALDGKAIEECVEYDIIPRIVFLAPRILYNTIANIVSETTLGKVKVMEKEHLLCNFEANE